MVVTGGHSRLGREVSRALAAAGASVTVAARDTERASAAVADLPGVTVDQLDLTDPASIDAFAERWQATGRPLHALVNNAAMLFSPERRLDGRGHEPRHEGPGPPAGRRREAQQGHEGAPHDGRHARPAHGSHRPTVPGDP